jgi:hypothetical protein
MESSNSRKSSNANQFGTDETEIKFLNILLGICSVFTSVYVLCVTVLKNIISTPPGKPIPSSANISATGLAKIEQIVHQRQRLGKRSFGGWDQDRPV